MNNISKKAGLVSDMLLVSRSMELIAENIIAIYGVNDNAIQLDGAANMLADWAYEIEREIEGDESK